MLRRLMGRAALHQQGPNEVRHRFSPHDHGNVKVPRRDRTSPARLTGALGGGRAARQYGRLWEIGHQYYQSTFRWRWRRKTRRDVRHRKQPCWARRTGTCFYYYRSGGAGVRALSIFYGGRGAFDWWLGRKLQNGCSGVWFTGSSPHCNEA